MLQHEAVSISCQATRRCKGYCGRAGAERNAVLAGDPKGIRLFCNTTLITDIPSRGSKEERIRIHLQVWANIRNNGYKR